MRRIKNSRIGNVKLCSVDELTCQLNTIIMNNKYIYDIDVCKADAMSLMLARSVVKKMSDLDINMTALNRLYLKASNNYFRS